MKVTPRRFIAGFFVFALLLACIFIPTSSSAISRSQVRHINERYPFSILKTIGDTKRQKRLLLKDNSTHDKFYFAVPPAVVIKINGEQTEFDNLSRDDKLSLEFNSSGVPESIEVRRVVSGIITSKDGEKITITPDYVNKSTFILLESTLVHSGNTKLSIDQLHSGDRVTITPGSKSTAIKIDVEHFNPALKFWNNFKKNLFKPLLLFFYLGFLTVALRVPFEFPQPIYQGLTIYLLLAIGWHGGEELASLPPNSLGLACSYMALGFFTNLAIGFIAYFLLRKFVPSLRKIDASTVAAYYGSDSAGTFVTCIGVLQAAAITFAAYMPVMLAVMEIPGCLVGLFLASRLRKQGMDEAGNMPGEYDYKGEPDSSEDAKEQSFDSEKVVREIFLNPGLFLLIGGITVGFVSRLQGPTVTAPDDRLFISLFQGILCLFLLEMGMNAGKRLKDLRYAGSSFVALGILMPNLFALIGIMVTNIFSHITGVPVHLGTYALFSVLCASASYIAVPAIQRLAIPEASPTLPLAASLGLTFTYNVTIGIPLYLAVAENIIRMFPVG